MVNSKTRHISLIIIITILIVQVASTLNTNAQVYDVRIINSIDLPINVIVNGSIIVIKPKTSISRSPGALLCIANQTITLENSIRIVFAGWLVNGILNSNKCINTEPGFILEPYYQYEYLITVHSVPEGLYIHQEWVKRGTIKITVPKNIELPGARYTLIYTDAGIIKNGQNNSATLELSVSSPLIVKLYYKPEYHVTIRLDAYNLDNIDLWINDGFLSVVSIPPEIYINDREKLVLSGITSAGADVKLLTPLGTIEILPRQPGAQIFPIYSKYYLVRYETAAGVTEKWVREGDQLTIDSMSQRIQETGDRRLVFERWEGDIVSLNPIVTIVVDKPLDIRAVYRIEWHVTVDSLIGSREYWVPDGGTQVIYVPPELPGVLIGRQLTFYLVNGQRVDPGPGGFLKLGPVTEPVQVVAIYKSVILWNNIAVLAGLLIGVVLIYIAYDLYTARQRSEDDTVVVGNDDYDNGNNGSGSSSNPRASWAS